MKILGIVGSMRKSGNTSNLVQATLRGCEKEGASTEVIYFSDYSLNNCRGCERCKDTYQCQVKDDMNDIYSLLLEADGIVLGSPTYYYNVSSLVKAFIDKTYSFLFFDEEDRSCWISYNEALGTKYAVAIAVCEQQDKEDMGFTMEAMTKPLADVGYRIVDKIAAINFWGPDEVKEDKEILQRAEEAGIRLMKTMKLRKRIEEKFKNK